MGYNNYDASVFERQVREALQTVERVLERPRGSPTGLELPGTAEHSYQEGYGLVDTATNTAIAAQLATLARLGLTSEILKEVEGESTVVLRFEASDSCSFLKEETVEVPSEESIVQTETTSTSNPNSFFGGSSKTKITRVIKKVKEFHWKVNASWEISLLVGGGAGRKIVLMQRSGSAVLVRQSVSKPPLPEHRACKPLECPLGWYLANASDGTTSFRVDPHDPRTRTPFRNPAVEIALHALGSLEAWAQGVRAYFVKCLQADVLDRNQPALPISSQSNQSLSALGGSSIFVPILGLLQENNEEREEKMETDAVDSDEPASEPIAQRFLSLPAPEHDQSTSALLPVADLHKLLEEHARSLDAEVAILEKNFPARHLAKLVSAAEAAACVLSCHLTDLTTRYRGFLFFLQRESERKLVAALGKTVTAADVDQFCRWHNARFLSIPPTSFCRSIRTPGKYPDGLLSVEKVGEDGEPIVTLSREVNQPAPLRVPLHAATSVTLSGPQYLHGWVRHRFGPSYDSYHLAARARQFSSFVLIVGTMAGPGELDPKNAIILRNKDELLLPLLLEDLPTAKEFKDTIKNLSPEQQNFAKAFRSMQLGSSVLGICVVRIKPQLETLLGLPPDALTKEIGLTEDLMELFVDHQVPSDLLSYDGPEEASSSQKTEAVRAHVASVKGVIDGVKQKELEEQIKRADMAQERMAMTQEQMATEEEYWEPQNDGRLSYYSAPSGGAMRSAKSIIAPRMRNLKAELRQMAAPPRPKPRRAVMALSAPMAEPEPCVFRAYSRPIPDDCDGWGTEEAEGATFDNLRDEIDEIEEASATSDMGAEPIGDLSASAPAGAVTFDATAIPKLLDSTVEKFAADTALRPTIIKTQASNWTRKRQENLLTKPKTEKLLQDEIRSEKDKAFDLLDALSRSGALPISSSELHVVVAVTHCFEKEVMDTIIEDNVNPIEKLEMSTLLVGSVIHNTPAPALVRSDADRTRLRSTFPLLLGPAKRARLNESNVEDSED